MTNGSYFPDNSQLLVLYNIMSGNRESLGIRKLRVSPHRRCAITALKEEDSGQLLGVRRPGAAFAPGPFYASIGKDLTK
ncbi:MAG: hypothetical protein ACRD9S_22740, partial [Pyrinomonadaceae bacterium]